MLQTTVKPFDAVSFISDYEGGRLEQDQVVAGFQELVNSGLAFQLQGSYGRMATQLIEQGLCARPAPKPMKPTPGISRSIGPFVGVSKDAIRSVCGENYRLLMYAAYNAFGLIGYEKNGVAVLSEDRKEVVCDELGCTSSGYYGATKAQLEMFEKLLTCPDAEFRELVNSSERSRYPI